MLLLYILLKKEKKITKFSNQGWMLMTICCNVNKFILSFRVYRFFFLLLCTQQYNDIKFNRFWCVKETCLSNFNCDFSSIENAFKKHLQNIIFIKQYFRLNSCYLIKYAVFWRALSWYIPIHQMLKMFTLDNAYQRQEAKPRL